MEGEIFNGGWMDDWWIDRRMNIYTGGCCGKNTMDNVEKIVWIHTGIEDIGTFICFQNKNMEKIQLLGIEVCIFIWFARKKKNIKI